MEAVFQARWSQNWCMTAPMKDPMITKHISTGAQRLGWARAVRSDDTVQSDARVRRACRIFQSEACAHDYEQDWARDTLAILQGRT